MIRIHRPEFGDGTMWLAVLFSVALLATTISGIYMLDRPLTGPHCAASAHLMIMGRTFARLGILRLGGVPVQNNPPLGAAPHIYVDWPPLTPMVLGVVFRLIGAGEAPAAAVTLAFTLFTASTVVLLVRTCAPPRSALLAGLAYLATPVVAKYASSVLYEHLAILLTTVAVLLFSQARRGPSPLWTVVAAMAAGLAAFAGWESLLALPGFFLAGWLSHDRRAIRRAWILTAAAASAVTTFLGLYFGRYPEAIRWLATDFLFRIGARAAAPGTATPIRPSLARLAWQYLDYLGLLSPVSLLALGGVVVALWLGRRRLAEWPELFVLAPLLAMPILFFTVFRGHAYYHDFTMLMFAPLAAVATGMVARLLERVVGSGEGWTRVVPALEVVAGLVLIAPLVSWSGHSLSVSKGDSLQVALGREIARTTPTGSVVITADDDLVERYYAARRIWPARGDLSLAMREARRSFPPGTPLYVAVPPEVARDEQRVLAASPVVAASRLLLIFRVSS